MSEPQHMRALNKANAAKRERARLNAEIRSLPRAEAFGLVADIIECPPWWVESMTVFDLFMAVRHMGRHFTLRLLREFQIGELRRVGELTARQRVEVAGSLRPESERVAA